MDFRVVIMEQILIKEHHARPDTARTTSPVRYIPDRQYFTYI